MKNSIVASYNDAISVSFNSDAWFNATAVAASFGKRPVDWLALDSTKHYIGTLSEILNCEESSLLKAKAGRHGGGTWFHPKLGVAFARWLDVRFSIWCDMQIEKILHEKPYAIKDLRSKKALPGGLSLAQQDAIKELVKARVEALPAEKRGGAAITLWSSLKTHFGCTYKLIPPDQFTDALSLIARVELGEAMPIPHRIETPRHAHYAHAREQHASLMSWGKRALPPRVQEEFYLAMKELEGALITGWTEMDEACMHLAIANAMLKRWKNGR